MKHKEEKNNAKQMQPLVKFTAVLRRLQSTTQVVSETTRPWDRGGRAKDIIESSERDAEAIGELSADLFKNLSVAQKLLWIDSEAPIQYEMLCQKANESSDDSVKTRPGDTAHELLSLVSSFCREMADYIKSVWITTPDWISKQWSERREEGFEYASRSLDYARWQILKGFAKLETIFDDHQDPDSEGPTDAWQRDQAAIDSK